MFLAYLVQSDTKDCREGLRGRFVCWTTHRLPQEALCDVESRLQINLSSVNQDLDSGTASKHSDQ